MVATTQTVFIDAKVGILKINDGSVLRDLSPYVKKVAGLPGQFKVNDVTTYGSVGERPGPSIFVVHFTVDFLFNMVTDVGVHTVLGAMHSGKALRAFEWYPAGVNSGDLKVSGNAYLPIYEITSEVGNYITVRGEFHADNGVSQGTA
jgi:hypothetical protein